MNLSDMKKKEPTTAWFDFSDGVRVQLVYIDPAAVRAIATECVKVVNGREEFDQDKALAKMAERILSWTGLTFGKVAELINIAVPAEMVDAEVPCVDENKIALLRDSWQFKPFVEQRTARLADFIAANREAEKKNLEAYSDWTFSGGITCDECRAIEQDTGQQPLCKTGESCGKVNLLPANIEAWELYNRVWDQIESFPVADGKQFHTYLRAEAVKAVIDLAGSVDPLGTYDKVMLIHRVKHKT